MTKILALLCIILLAMNCYYMGFTYLSVEKVKLDAECSKRVIFFNSLEITELHSQQNSILKIIGSYNNLQEYRRKVREKIL